MLLIFYSYAVCVFFAKIWKFLLNPLKSKFLPEKWEFMDYCGFYATFARVLIFPGDTTN
jgi:hypothetical protein